MSNVASIYTNAMRDNFRPMFANWQPGSPLKLGDYGLITNNIFQRIGKIGDPDIGIEFKTRLDETGDQYEFSSSSETEFLFTAGGQVNTPTANVKAGLEIRFGKSDSVYFNAAGCKVNSIENIKAVGDALIALDEQGKWKRDFAVVTNLIASGATTVVVSGGNNSSIVLEASGGVPQIDLADASLKLSLKSMRNVALKIITTGGMTPLMALMQVKRREIFPGILRPRTWEPAAALPFDPNDLGERGFDYVAY